MAQALLWTFLHDDPQCPSRAFLAKVAHSPIPIAVRLRHRNRWRATWQRNRRKGRPRRGPDQRPVAAGAAVVHVIPRLSYVGVPLFATWLDHQGLFGTVVEQLTQVVAAHQPTHPGDDFALFHHRAQTLRRRFQALFFAPLVGIDRLTACDTHEHPLGTLRGRGSHSSTLHQCLGPRARVGAAEALRSTLFGDKAGQCISVDGPMIASGSRMAMHKGKITMLGRILAGSQAVMAHDDAGQALFGAYDPPDFPLSQVIGAYCQRVALATGNSLFVIDRAVTSVALAEACDEQGLGLLCMLDDNEYDGLESLAATEVDRLEDGTRV